MTRLLYILVILCGWSATGIAQEHGSVSVHTDPRLALLISKSSSPDRDESDHVPAAKRDMPVRKAAAKTATEKPRNSEEPAVRKEERRMAASAEVKEIKEVKDKRKFVAGESRGGRYNGTGFRVQIYNGPDRDKALRIKSEFMRNYPGVRTYLIYTSPAYRVKVGDYRRREDAVSMFKEANSSYSPCMIVPDRISIN